MIHINVRVVAMFPPPTRKADHGAESDWKRFSLAHRPSPQQPRACIQEQRFAETSDLF